MEKILIKGRLLLNLNNQRLIIIKNTPLFPMEIYLNDMFN